ncbi:hypothetical protein C7974DRAFT_388221 [Boeremia exigua]|uniref:uncharacterized protein n=1 Tax=Boeremia exigua TaxID=749465 RepID=UPI001E8D2122|nr:uncharacterized protein C7974DRAFT_388221 [Boeremia exigua]KAH6639302.1 hypothetical protein C7974DRAFT_388221 [Boeremia exigua]
MFTQLQLVVAAASLWQHSSATPADPTITTAAVLPRQNSDAFIGYIRENNTWSSQDCDPGLFWFQGEKYAQCCPTTLSTCYPATACVGGTQIYTYPDVSSVSSIACTENYNDPAFSICNTIFIYENSGLGANHRTNIVCGKSSKNWTFFREIPTSTSESVDTTTTPAAPATETATPEPESSSKAWIAGVVAGPVLGLALIGAGVWFCLRRRKKKNAQVAQHGAATMAHMSSSQPPPGVGGYTDAKPQFQPAQPTYYNQPGQLDPYAQQGYPQQGSFSPPQGSPAPQYGFQSAYNTTASPPSGAYAQDVKYGAPGGAVELGGDSSGIVPAASSVPGSPRTDAAPPAQVAELGATDATPVHSGKPH